MKALVLMLLATSLFGQGAQRPATSDELDYLRFLLLNMGSIDRDPNATKSEYLLAKQFGLNDQETVAIRAAGLELKTLLIQQRQTARALVPGRTGFSASDAATFRALSTQREQRIEVLANRILNQVRPQVAERLRKPGREIAEKRRSVTRR